MILLATAFAVAGCGGSRSPTAERLRGAIRGDTPASSAEALPAIALNVSVPGMPSSEDVPRRYTCYGNDISLPVRWSGIPQGTAELALFVMNFRPVRHKLFFDWAVLGLKPASDGIAAGGLPGGATIGRNSLGQASYSMCPPRSRRESYVVRLLALHRRITARPGFAARPLYREVEPAADVVGFAIVSYTAPS
ncbi:MAG: YbhB/YbcL family Raf kinase inhibitor-like protein [Solirubrobacteraceae bacterium]